MTPVRDTEEQRVALHESLKFEMLQQGLLRYAVPVTLVALLAVCWIADRTRLSHELATLKRELDRRELTMQDKAEFDLFNDLEPGQTTGDHPDLHLLADDLIAPGHQHFDYCTAFLSEQFPDVSIDFTDCNIVVFDVAAEAVPFRGGSYWIVTRNDCIILTFPYMTIIGG